MTRIDYTAEQTRALETRGVAVTVDAGAGCGKTFVLTERFLSHLDPSAGPAVSIGQIAAITFTDAAAREMRDRVRTKCRERWRGAVDTGDDASAKHWRSVLRTLESARISTIHAFASRLIRDHAVELGVDPAFTVLDPAEAEVLKTQAVDATLRERFAPKAGQLDEEVIALGAELDVIGLRQRARDLVDAARSQSVAHWRRATPDDLVERWIDRYRERVAPEMARRLLEDPRTDQLREVLANASPVNDSAIERRIELLAAIDQLAAGEDADAALKRFQAALSHTLEGSRKHAFTKKDWPSEALDKRYRELRKELEDVLKKQRRPSDPEAMRLAAETGLRLLRIADAAARRFAEAKRARGVLDNDDLLIEAHRLLTAPEMADARRRARDALRMLLVDEFQDTDQLQAELIQALAAPSGPAADDALELFVVGDFKQSIYRFRGAEPEVFNRLRSETPEQGRLRLSQNFRSRPEVLSFVNTLFGGVFGEAYAPLHAHRDHVGEPTVEFLWTPPASDGSNASIARRAEARTIAARVQGLIASGRRAGEVALLFRALSDVALYEDALREAGIDYYLVGGHAFYSQQEVYDLLNLLRAIASECDDIALAGALRSPFFGLPDAALYWLAREGGLNAGLAAFESNPAVPAELRAVIADASARLRELRDAKDRGGAAELLDMAFDVTGYDAVLRAEFLGDRKLANLEKLHEQARAADASGAGLRGYVARLTEFVNRPPKEALAATTAGDADVVRLMTVHAAKGLEFPIVFLPDLTRKVQPDKTQAKLDPDWGPLVKPPSNDSDTGVVGIDLWRAEQKPLEDAERDRLFYVACTRAADRLILSGYRDADTPNPNPWMVRLAERFDLETGELLDDEGQTGRLPLVTITPPTEPTAAEPPERSQLGKAIDEAEQAPKPRAVKLPPFAQPIGPDARGVATLSVTRLNGRLRHGDAVYSRAEPSSGNTSAAEIGRLVHAVIELIEPDRQSDSDALRALTDGLASRHLRRATDEAVTFATRLVERFVSSSTWAAMRETPSLRREVEFLLPWNPLTLLRGYIDALYQDDHGGWRIVDYKTNRLDAADVPKAAEQYRLQMAIYAHAAEAALGEPIDSTTLLFLSPGVEHRLDWDDATRSASRSWIEEAIQSARSVDSHANQP